jgi:hypothetical protein
MSTTRNTGLYLGLLLGAALATCLTGCNTTGGPSVSYGIEDNPAYRSKEMNGAYTLLTNPAQFPDPQPGKDLPLKPEVKAFRKILKESDSGFVFENLYAQANDTGKLYALSGLYLTNPVGYEQARKDLTRRNRSVQVFDGEHASARRVKTIIGNRGSADAPVIANGNLPNLLGGELASSDEVVTQREILAKAHPNAPAMMGGGSAPTPTSGGANAGISELFTFSMPTGRPKQEIDYAPSLGESPSNEDLTAAPSSNVALAGNFQSTNAPQRARARQLSGSTLKASTADTGSVEAVTDNALANFKSRN